MNSGGGGAFESGVLEVEEAGQTLRCVLDGIKQMAWHGSASLFDITCSDRGAFSIRAFLSAFLSLFGHCAKQCHLN